jgi:hypothetical protein
MEWTGHYDYKSMKPYIKVVDKLKEKEMTKFNISISEKRHLSEHQAEQGNSY